ncbi:2OG-Fe(II) oxygenase family protein [Sessilibacter sp. MAH4]
MSYTLNPQSFDKSAAIEIFRNNRRARISSFLSLQSAIQIQQTVMSIPVYHQACFVDGQSQLINPTKFAELDISQRQEFIKKIYAQAAQGTGFWYGRYEPNGEVLESVQKIKNWLESDEMLSLMREISGYGELTRITMQLTRYNPGDFLTRHNDLVSAENRKIAYVLNLAPKWHPDWGGLLQFYQPNGTPIESWSPDFNSFGIFDVSLPHSVTSVAQFSPASRYTISGWYHS